MSLGKHLKITEKNLQVLIAEDCVCTNFHCPEPEAIDPEARNNSEEAIVEWKLSLRKREEALVEWKLSLGWKGGTESGSDTKFRGSSITDFHYLRYL